MALRSCLSLFAVATCSSLLSSSQPWPASSRFDALAPKSTAFLTPTLFPKTTPALRLSKRPGPSTSSAASFQAAYLRKKGVTTSVFATAASSQTSPQTETEEDSSLGFITLFRDEVRTTKLQSMETGVLKLKTDEDDSQEIDFVWARFGERKSISDVEIAVVAPVTADKDIENGKELEGKLVVVKRGVNSFSDKCERIAACGAAGVIIVNTDNELISPSASANASALPIPVIAVAQQNFDLLQRPGSRASLQVEEEEEREGEREGERITMPCVAASTPLFPGEQTEMTVSAASLASLKSRSLDSFAVCYRRGNGPMAAVATTVKLLEMVDTGRGTAKVVLEGTGRVEVVGWANATDNDGEMLAYSDEGKTDSAEALKALKQNLNKVTAAMAENDVADSQERRELLEKVLATEDATEAGFLVGRALSLNDRQRQLLLQTRSPSLRLSALNHMLSRTAERYARTLRRRLAARDLPISDPRRSFVSDVAKAVLPAMVKLRPKLLRNTTTQGSGFIISEDGVLVTNAHVASLSVGVEVILSNGTKMGATLLHRDKDWDIAVLQLNASDGGGGAFPTVPLGDSDAAERGDWAIAMGNPSDQDNIVTMGVVTGFKRNNHASLLDRSNDYLLTDALVSPGMSGGPLLNAQGEVVGVNTFIRSDMAGMGFCLAVNRVRDILELVEKQRKSQALDGLHTRGEVWLYNDRFNTKARIAAMLAEIFKMGPDESEQVMMEAHKSGRALVGTWDREEAEDFAKRLNEADILAECTPALPPAS